MDDSEHLEQIDKATLTGEREVSGKLNPDGIDHNHLLAIMQTRPTDYEPYGMRYRDSADCSWGCKWFSVLKDFPMDWGVCANPRSPRCGLLTFEHQGCQQFEAEEEEEEEE